MNKTVGVLFAAVTGFVAGILLAPKSGKETRQELMEKSKQYKGKAEEGLDEAKRGARLVKDEIAEGAKSVKDIAQDAGAGASRAADRFKSEVSQRAAIIKDEVGSTAKNVRERVK